VSRSTISKLLGELAAISPMPSDAALLEDTEDLADRYDALIEQIGQHLTDEPLGAAEEAAVVRVLADSFGLGGGMGVYWGTLHLIERCTPSVALPIIQDRAIHGLAGSRSWCAFILGRRRDSEDLPLFLALLNDDTPEVQAQALQSLKMLSQRESLQHVLPRVYPLLEHPDPRVRKAAQSTLEAIGG
jgi:HEAT repeat protein